MIIDESKDFFSNSCKHILKHVGPIKTASSQHHWTLRDEEDSHMHRYMVSFLPTYLCVCPCVWRECFSFFFSFLSYFLPVEIQEETLKDYHLEISHNRWPLPPPKKKNTLSKTKLSLLLLIHLICLMTPSWQCSPQNREVTRPTSLNWVVLCLIALSHPGSELTRTNHQAMM